MGSDVIVYLRPFLYLFIQAVHRFKPFEVETFLSPIPGILKGVASGNVQITATAQDKNITNTISLFISPAASITSPQSGTTVNPGDSVIASVEALNVGGVNVLLNRSTIGKIIETTSECPERQ